MVSMRLIKTDIDELLESTRELSDEQDEYSFISTIEIDYVLELTQDW